MTPNKIGSEYLHRLQGVYHRIANRGFLVDDARLKEARRAVNKEIEKHLGVIKNAWGCHVYLGADNDDGTDTSVNLNASSGKRTPLLKLKSLGYNIPKVSSRNDEGDYESKESLAELALQKMLVENQFNHPTGDPVIKAILDIRELITLKNRYINVLLYSYGGYNYFLSSYNVAGTTTGRRSSKKHIFNFGNNGQNLPSRGESAKYFKRCLISRPNKVFLHVDQIQAEDWPVSALSYNLESLKDLSSGVDRHKKLAMAIFNIPSNYYSPEDWGDSQERFLGKKTRHAYHYGMREFTMSDSLAKEGYAIPYATCRVLLDKIKMIDPSVEGTFHTYVQRCLYTDRMLITPFGRERQFFGLRAGDTSGNNKIFREAYSFIPQSVVGDNTGLAVYYLEALSKLPGCVLQEGHDSIIQEMTDSVDVLWEYIQETIKAFDREIEFYNGITLKIPIEGKISYDLNEKIAIKNNSTGSKRLTDISYKDIQIAYRKLQEKREKERLESVVEHNDNEQQLELKSQEATA